MERNGRHPRWLNVLYYMCSYLVQFKKNSKTQKKKSFKTFAGVLFDSVELYRSILNPVQLDCK